MAGPRAPLGSEVGAGVPAARGPCSFATRRREPHPPRTCSSTLRGSRRRQRRGALFWRVGRGSRGRDGELRLHLAVAELQPAAPAKSRGGIPSVPVPPPRRRLLRAGEQGMRRGGGREWRGGWG